MIRRVLCLLAVLALLPVTAISSGMEYANMANEQLLEMNDRLTDELIARGLSAYISISGKKYHCKQDCSGIEAAMRVPVNDLTLCGYEPCKRCYK